MEQLENDLLEELENIFFIIAQKRISQLKEITSPMSINTFRDLTLSFFTEYGELLYHLLGSSGDPAFGKKIFELFKLNFTAIHNIPQDSQYADYLASFVFAIILNDLEYWFEHKDSITMQEVIALTYKLLGNGFDNHFFYNSVSNI